MSLKAFDAVAAATWTAMGLFLLAGLFAFAWNPAPRTFYGSDTGFCDSGCGDSR